MKKKLKRNKKKKKKLKRSKKKKRKLKKRKSLKKSLHKLKKSSYLRVVRAASTIMKKKSNRKTLSLMQHSMGLLFRRTNSMRTI
jgi:hypothetical protein